MIAEFLAKFLAKAVTGSNTVWGAVMVATCAVGETLAKAIDISLACDFSRMKEAHLRRIEARTDAERAEVKKRLAEAATAANTVTKKSHAEEVARLERERLALENRKKAAEAAQLEAGANILKTKEVAARFAAHLEMLEAVAEAREDHIAQKRQAVFDALQQLQAEGGMLYADREQLKKLSDGQPPGGIGALPPGKSPEEK